MSCVNYFTTRAKTVLDNSPKVKQDQTFFVSELFFLNRNFFHRYKRRILGICQVTSTLCSIRKQANNKANELQRREGKGHAGLYQSKIQITTFTRKVSL